LSLQFRDVLFEAAGGVKAACGASERNGSAENPAEGFTAMRAGGAVFIDQPSIASGKRIVRYLQSEHQRASSPPSRPGMSFADWCSLSWFHVVGSGNFNHLHKGADVSRVRSWRGVVSYAAKYMSKTDAENFLPDVSSGRSWGIFNREMIPWAKMIELDLDEETGCRLRRIARRYLENRLGRKWRAPYGITCFCDTKFLSAFLPRPPEPF
jgi:hypothetical protein